MSGVDHLALERRFGGLIGHCPANRPELAWRIRYLPKPGGAENQIYQGPGRAAALRKCAEIEAAGGRVLKAATG